MIDAMVSALEKFFVAQHHHKVSGKKPISRRETCRKHGVPKTTFDRESQRIRKALGTNGTMDLALVVRLCRNWEPGKRTGEGAGAYLSDLEVMVLGHVFLEEARRGYGYSKKKATMKIQSVVRSKFPKSIGASMEWGRSKIAKNNLLSRFVKRCNKLFKEHDWADHQLTLAKSAFLDFKRCKAMDPALAKSFIADMRAFIKQLKDQGVLQSEVKPHQIYYADEMGAQVSQSAGHASCMPCA